MPPGMEGVCDKSVLGSVQRKPLSLSCFIIHLNFCLSVLYVPCPTWQNAREVLARYEILLMKEIHESGHRIRHLGHVRVCFCQRNLTNMSTT